MLDCVSNLGCGLGVPVYVVHPSYHNLSSSRASWPLPSQLSFPKERKVAFFAPIAFVEIQGGNQIVFYLFNKCNKRRLPVL